MKINNACEFKIEIHFEATLCCCIAEKFIKWNFQINNRSYAASTFVIHLFISNLTCAA
jgi:hypothetical protein